MKRIALLLGLVGAGLTGCNSIDSRVAVREDGLNESAQVVSDQDSSPRPLPIVERWQKLMVKIREQKGRRERTQEETGEGPELIPVPVSSASQVASQEENQTPAVAHAGGIVRPQKATRLPSPTSLVQVSASQTSSPKSLPSDSKPFISPSAPSNAAAEKVADAGDSGSGKIPVRAVNSRRIVLEYEIKDIGPSGVSTVDLWYTRDGRRWEKCPTGAQRTSPYVLEVKEEGLYGITLVASSGIGLKKRPPRPGDNAQVWIDVDVTKPMVRLTGCTVGTGADADSLTITWRAADKHLGERPITLSYAEQADGPWSTIVANVENTGSYVWKMPSNVPQRLMIRLEATDLAGNVGLTQTHEPVLVDLAKPNVSILSVRPMAN
jgi:hypothetical protein